MIRSLLIATSCLAIAFPSFIQAQAKQQGILQVRFLAERIPKQVGQVRLHAGDWKSTDFDLPSNHFSVPLNPPDRIFQIWSSAMNVALAQVNLPEPDQSFVVILVPSASGSYRAVVLPAENPEFRDGDVYFYNHTDKAVFGFVGSSKFKLGPSKGTILRPAGAKGDGKFYDVGLGFRDADGDRPLSIARWPIQQGIRMYVFFYINPQNQRIDFRAVDEFIEPSDPTE